MCLDISKNSKRLKAEEDIICYKFVIKIDNIYKTPYRNCIIKIGKTYKSQTERIFTSKLCKFDEIKKGLHSFINERDPKLVYVSSRTEIVKCIIPKGAWYYIGTFDTYKSYASTQLTYVEIIK